jgi:hypothetical protein
MDSLAGARVVGALLLNALIAANRILCYQAITPDWTGGLYYTSIR